MAGGRPSKWKDEYAPFIKVMALKGASDKEMADACGVTETTFNNWKISQKGFFEPLKDWKREADHKVVRALYERATGFCAKEDKIVGDQVVTLVKEYPPDTTAAIYWTKNRLPDEWRDKQEAKLEHTGPGGKELPPTQITVVHPGTKQ